MDAQGAKSFGVKVGRQPLDERLAKEEEREFDGLRREKTVIDRQYAAQRGVPQRIHVLGTGSIGKLVAHALQGIPKPPPVTLLFHRYALVKAWEASGKQITIVDDDYEVRRGGFDIELVQETRREHGVELMDGTPSVYDFNPDVRPHEAAKILDDQQRRASQQKDLEGAAEQRGGSSLEATRRPGDRYISQEPIDNLIITTKASRTISALSEVRHRLHAGSTICFLQNGMGIIDDVNKQLFPDEETRPNYVQGIITHGVNVPPAKGIEDPFYAVHAGHGTIALGLLPRGGTKQTTITPNNSPEPEQVHIEKWASSSRYLLRTLTRTPALCAVGFTPSELLQQQLEKLAVNSVLNPLTSLLDNRNGALLYNFALSRTMRLMLAETSHVIRSLPELQNIPNVQLRFSPERLETHVVSVANKTKDNISSMLADVRAGRKTEIDYINGYIVRRGEEIGIKCVVNYAIMQTVVAKGQMVQMEVADEVPIAGLKMATESE